VSALTCINDLEASGALDRDRASQFRLAYEDLNQTYKRQFGSQASSEKASAQLAGQLEAEAMQVRRQQLKQLGIQRGILTRLDQAMQNGEDVYRVAKAFFSRMEGVNGVTDIDLRHVAVRDLAWSKMGDFLSAMHRKIGGALGDPALMNNIVLELFGQATGDKHAGELAKAFTDTAEWLRSQFNMQGGAIGKLDGWGLPQAHDSVLVRKSSFEDWRDFILAGDGGKPLLDRARMIDNLTGLPFSDMRMDAALRDVYEHIRTDGFDQLAPGALTGAKVANRHLDSRFLHFKDADSWMQYQQKFGGNAWDAMTGHIDSMSRDIASMQVLGPNPAYTVRWLQDTLNKDANVRGGAKDQRAAAGAAKDIGNMWGVHTGDLNRSIDPRLSRNWATVRQLNSASKLGGAVLTGTADLGFTHAMANFNGLDATRLMANFVKNLNPLDDGDRALARHTGIIASEYTQRAIDLHQAHDTSAKIHEVSKRINDGVLRASGLHVLTTAGTSAIGKEFMQSVAENSGRAFADLDPKLQRVLQRYGIGQDYWDVIRSTPHNVGEHPDFGSVAILRPDEVAARTDIHPDLANEAATRFLEMIEGEKRFGMPDAGASLRVKAMLNWGGGNRGTWMGEIMHSGSQFKQFPVSVIDRSIQRAIYGDGSRLDRTKFMLNVTIATTIMGGLVLQMKSIANGRDPETIYSPEFWLRAWLQGGAVGIYGDFLKEQLVLPGTSQKVARDGKSVADLMMGPTLQSVADPVLRLGFHDTSMAATDELEGNTRPSNVGREVTQFLKENTPGSSLWYARAALNRELWDRVQGWIDPNAQGAFERQTQRAEEQDHQQFWWAPGQTAPDHAPDLSQALKGNQP